MFSFQILVSCTSTAEKINNYQLVIKFSDDIVDPEEPQFIEGLSDFAGFPMAYVKPGKRGTHVVRFRKPMAEEKLQKIVTRLSRYSGIDRIQPKLN